MEVLACLFTFSVVLLKMPAAEAKVTPDPAAKRLFYDLMTVSGYNALIRPSAGPSKKLTVKLGLRLSQVLAVVSTFHTLIAVCVR